jgi:hypothetical protein
MFSLHHIIYFDLESFYTKMNFFLGIIQFKLKLYTPFRYSFLINQFSVFISESVELYFCEFFLAVISFEFSSNSDPLSHKYCHISHKLLVLDEFHIKKNNIFMEDLYVPSSAPISLDKATAFYTEKQILTDFE